MDDAAGTRQLLRDAALQDAATTRYVSVVSGSKNVGT